MEQFDEGDEWIAPNDLCQTAKGHIYFTDPDFRERKESSVYRIEPQGSVTRQVIDMKVPNGIIASNDGKTLYVADSHETHWRAYVIRDDGSIGEGKVFFDPDTPDKRDPDGMYARARRGEIEEFTGINAPYEPPLAPEVHIHAEHDSVEDGAWKVLSTLELVGVIPRDSARPQLTKEEEILRKLSSQGYL